MSKTRNIRIEVDLGKIRAGQVQMQLSPKSTGISLRDKLAKTFLPKIEAEHGTC